jgi:hypothetical protein
MFSKTNYCRKWRVEFFVVLFFLLLGRFAETISVSPPRVPPTPHAAKSPQTGDHGLSRDLILGTTGHLEHGTSSLVKD